MALPLFFKWVCGPNRLKSKFEIIKNPNEHIYATSALQSQNAVSVYLF